jgi:hypothetical protein
MGTDSVCQGATNIQFNASITPATLTPTHFWRVTGNAAISGSNAGASVRINTTGAGSFTLTDSVRSGNGCFSICSKTVKINPTPSCIISGTDTLCQGSTGNVYSVSVSPAGGIVAYTWTVGANGSIVGDNNGPSVNLRATGTGSLVITVSITRNGCVSSCSKTININAMPICSISGPDSVCAVKAGHIFQSSINPSTGIISHKWTITGSASIVGANDQASIEILSGLSGSFTITDSSYRNGCLSVCTKYVKIFPTFFYSIQGSDSVCLNDSIYYSIYPDVTGLWQSSNTSVATINDNTGLLNPIAPGNTTIRYIVNTASCGSDTATKSVSVKTCITLLNLRAFIQGYYANSNYMLPVLYYSGISGSTPYEADSITIEIHDGQTGVLIGAPLKTVLQLDGNASVNIPALTGSHYIVLKHRNALETWSATPVAMGSNVSYDFTTAANKAYGSNQANMGSGKFAIYSGDVNQDGAIESTDYYLMENDLLAILFGYYPTDITGDGVVESSDYYLMENNIIQTIFVARPF